MIYRSPRLDEQALYEQLPQHPLQSYFWGKFRETTGVTVERLMGFEDNTPKKQMQLTFHQLPKLPYTVGYYPKGEVPGEVGLQALKELGKRHKALFIKLEPNVSTPPTSSEAVAKLKTFLFDHGCQEGRPLFTPHSFILNLEPSEEELLTKMKSKTRYNVKVAQKHGVSIVEDNSAEGFSEYLQLLGLTTSRQGFYAHGKAYQEKMWQIMGKAGIARLLKATYQEETLAAWIVFVYRKTLYYPYGASSRKHREVMASNLLMWETIRYGKRQGCTRFDMWGSLGPEPDPKDPWYGFHNFKAGYGGDLATFVGSYDLVLDYPLYQIYRVADRWRWRLLRFKSKLPFMS